MLKCLRIALTALSLTACVPMEFVLGFASVATAETKVRTTQVPHGGRAAAAKMDSNGTIHLVFNSANGPQYVSSTDNGQTFTGAIPIQGKASQKTGLLFSAWDMAIGAGGRVHVVMGANAWELKRPQEEWALYHAYLDPGTGAFSPIEKVIDPSIDPCDCCTTSCTYGADGKLAILYREETNNKRDMYLVLRDENRQSVSKRRISSTLWEIDACPMTYFTVTTTPNGYVAAWPTQGQVYFARMDAKGVVQPPGEIKTAGTTGMRTGILALTNSSGETLIAWKQGDELRWQLYDPQGLPLAEPGSLESAGNGVAGIVDRSDEFLLFR
jgi:hypothetical protein